jgi:hypothetical protein
MATPKKDYTNKKVGRLLAIRFVEMDKYSNAKWLFRCDCGKEIIRPAYCVMNKQGNTKSCGCLSDESRIIVNTKHGMSKSRFYRIWAGVIDRCSAKKGTRNYKWYGKKGIKVCEKWKKFENFRDDLIKLYEEHTKIYGVQNTTIDRINNSGDYEPKNVRFATIKEQANNRCTNKIIPSQA